MATLVEVSPFVKPCPDDEMRYIDCEKGVQVKDLLATIADLLGRKPNDLNVVHPRADGCNVVLGAKEAIPARVCIKGTKSLVGVPPSVLVKPKAFRSTFTKSEAMNIQQDTIDAYSDPLLQLQLKSVQKAMVQRLSRGDAFKAQDYTGALRPLISAKQDKILAKWDFELGQKGFANMQSIFNTHFETDAEVQANVLKINALTGTDFSWVPETIDRGNLASRTPQATAQNSGPGASESYE